AGWHTSVSKFDPTTYLTSIKTTYVVNLRWNSDSNLRSPDVETIQTTTALHSFSKINSHEEQQIIHRKHFKQTDSANDTEKNSNSLVRNNSLEKANEFLFRTFHYARSTCDRECSLMSVLRSWQTCLSRNGFYRNAQVRAALMKHGTRSLSRERLFCFLISGFGWGRSVCTENSFVGCSLKRGFLTETELLNNGEIKANEKNEYFTKRGQ
ncbi:hypothetical protein AVEN_2147-1, partial [Araneus ventricosus]